MRILIIGATGFIGRELVNELAVAGHDPVAVTRNAEKAKAILGSRARIVEWDGRSGNGLAVHIGGCHALINLSGENIGSGPWTPKRKRLITESRTRTGRLICEAIRLATEKPAVLIQASAIGYYGTPVDFPAGEEHPAGTGFIAGLAREWESSVAEAAQVIPRVVFLRTGLVLGRNGGIMKKMMLPFKFYSGAVIGPGTQWMSWIHIRDTVWAICFLLENRNCSGPFNLTSPNPVRMKTFISSLAKRLGRPAWFNVPGFALKIALGQMAQETILSSQNIYPDKLVNAGFEFKYPDLNDALTDLISK